ncbi:MAG: UvrB/UvrC motif-containing protein [Candidatus Omnitrophota bacterium]|jgi:protein arginine kinase activator
MVCDICHKNIATVHLTEVINDKVVEMHICQHCTKTEEFKENLSVQELLGGLMDLAEAKNKEKISLKCTSCGLTYDDFKKKARLGCCKCYLTFKQQLMPLLKKIHGSLHYTGKRPLDSFLKISRDNKTEELQKRLDRAIQLEEFEEAARLRDELKKQGSRE